MSYCSVDDFRRMIFDDDEITDDDIEYYINRATETIIDEISIPRRNEEMDGSINGSNKEFNTVSHPIADLDGNKLVNASDVTVYAWGEKDDIDTRVEMSVSTINAYEGRIVLSSAPASTFSVITCDYSFYITDVDLTRLTRACANLAGYYYIRREMLLIPEYYSLGAGRFRHTKPYKELLYDYYNELLRAAPGIIIKKRHPEIEIKRTRLR